jgi:hypothetical protein
MESLAYIMVYLKRGKLPWLRKLNANMSRRQRYDLVTKRKLETTAEDITNGLPEELTQFFQYCRDGIEFDERPDYGYLKLLLHSLIHRLQFSNAL